MYANGTTHYNLPQTVGTDKRDWTDTNQAFADIDAALYTASETASSAASDIVTLGETVGTHGEDIAGLKEDVSGLQTTVGEQGLAITALGNKIDNVEDDALDMICAVDEGTAQVASVAVNEGEYFRYNNVLYMATANIAIGDTIVPNTNCRATNVATELQAVAPGGEVIDSTARTEIGTMSNLNTTDKTSLVAAINEVLSQIGGGGMPELDYGNPVKTFGASDSYTAVAGDYLHIAGIVGDSASEAGMVNIDGEPVAKSYLTSTSAPAPSATGNFKLHAGQVLTTNSHFSAVSAVTIVREFSV